MKALIELLKNLFGMFATIISDEVGEYEVDDGTQDDDANDDENDDGSTVDDDDDDGSNDDDDDATQQFGGYSSIEELVSAHETMKGQTSATEGNLRKLRSALKKHGIVYDSDSDALAVMQDEGTQESKQKRQSKFTDEHREKFSRFFSAEGDDKEVISATRDEFLNLMDTLVEDRVESMLLNFQEKSSKQMKERMQFKKEYDEATKEMFASYPQLVEGNEQFDQEFYDAVLEHIENNPRLRKLSDGELIAADRVARQRNISPIQISRAKKKAYMKGSEKKTIVSSSSGKQAKGGFKRLSEDEYLALSTDERNEYNKKLLNIN